MSWQGQNIKYLRKMKKMTQKEFSEYLEIPVPTLRQWETGTRIPPNYIYKLIKTKIQYDELLMEYIKIKNRSVNNEI